MKRVVPAEVSEEVMLRETRTGLGSRIKLTTKTITKLLSMLTLGLVVVEDVTRVSVEVEEVTRGSLEVEVATRIAQLEAVVIVGAVEIHQQIAQSAEEGERAGRAVDKLPAGAFGGECAFHEEAAVFAGFGPVFLEEGGEVFFGGIFKDGLDRAGLGPAANEGLVGAFAEEEGEGADDDGFSRAGLAGDGGEAREGFPRDVLDEGEIANSQRGERCRHGWTMP